MSMRYFLGCADHQESVYVGSGGWGWRQCEALIGREDDPELAASARTPEVVRWLAVHAGCTGVEPWGC